MKANSKIRSVETLAADAGFRNYYFVKITTEDGIVGWSEYDEGFGAPGVGTAIEKLSARVVGQPVGDHERIYSELYSITRPAAGGVVALALGAIENALLDAKAKALGVPVYMLLGGNVRDRVRVYLGVYTAPDAEEVRDRCLGHEERYGLTAFKLSPFRSDPNVRPWGEVVRESAAYFERLRDLCPPRIEFAADGVRYELSGSLEAITGQA